MCRKSWNATINLKSGKKAKRYKKLEKGELSDIKEYYCNEVSHDENEKDEDFVPNSLVKEKQKTSILVLAKKSLIYKPNFPLQNVVKQRRTIYI